MQTAGGRTGVPAPRTVRRPPFVQIAAPLAWTTLALTIHADGSSDCEVVGASPFPRHWIYDRDGSAGGEDGHDRLQGLVPHRLRQAHAVGRRGLAGAGHRGRDGPRAGAVGHDHAGRRQAPDPHGGQQGDTLVEQGEPGDDLFLLLDGVLAVEVDGEKLAEVGPGAILGERAVLEGGARTATLRAVTPAKVAVASADQIDPDALAEVSKGHRREEAG